jgi:hypothetical protein
MDSLVEQREVAFPLTTRNNFRSSFRRDNRQLFTADLKIRYAPGTKNPGPNQHTRLQLSTAERHDVMTTLYCLVNNQPTARVE